MEKSDGFFSKLFGKRNPKSKACEKELDNLIIGVTNDINNNYKDTAKTGFLKFEKLFEAYRDQGNLSEKAVRKYEQKSAELKKAIQGHTHADQKPYWTK